MVSPSEWDAGQQRTEALEARVVGFMESLSGSDPSEVFDALKRNLEDYFGWVLELHANPDDCQTCALWEGTGVAVPIHEHSAAEPSKDEQILSALGDGDLRTLDALLQHR